MNNSQVTQEGEQEKQAVNYKIYDLIHYQFEMYIWDIAKQRWVPYVADDVVMEFKMLDPYYRKIMTHYVSEAGHSTYWTEFRVFAAFFLYFQATHKYGVF